MKTFLLSIALLFTFFMLKAQTGSPWQKLEGETPPARFNHTMVEINGKVYLYGGEVADETGNKSAQIDNGEKSTAGILSDLWMYTDEDTKWRAVTVTPTSVKPSARKYHAACPSNGKMYVFGGDSDDGVQMDVWEYDPETNTWTERPSVSEQNPKLFHCATAGDGKIWVTGGIDFTTNKASPETWVYDLSTYLWSKVASCPSPRYGHAAVYKDGKLIITGGRRDNELLTDMCQYNTATDTWSTITPAAMPAPVKFPAYVSTADILWMTGGTNIDTDGNYVDASSTWEYNLADNQWEEKTAGPAFTFGAGAVLPVTTKSADTETSYKVLVFGGSRNGVAIDEAWIYDSAKEAGTTNTINIDKGNNDLVSVYPTITGGAITIEGKQSIQSVSVYNLQGKLILIQKTDNKIIPINLNGNPNGLYLFKIKCSDQYFNRRVLLSE